VWLVTQAVQGTAYLSVDTLGEVEVSVALVDECHSLLSNCCHDCMFLLNLSDYATKAQLFLEIGCPFSKISSILFHIELG